MAVPNIAIAVNGNRSALVATPIVRDGTEWLCVASRSIPGSAQSLVDLNQGVRGGIR